MNVGSLGAMRRTMQDAHAIAGPGGVTASSASSVLATGTDFLTNATATVGALDTAIDVRRDKLDAGEQQGRSERELAHDREQVELLERLRDRIQLSIQRITDILAGSNHDDISSSDSVVAGASSTSTQQQARPWDMPSVVIPVAHSGDVSRVYAAGLRT